MLNDKVRNLPLGVKASIGYFIASIVTKGIAYLTTPIYTRLLSTAEYGQVDVFLTWLQIFGIVAMFCLHYGVFNNGMLDYKDDRDGFSFSMLVLSNIITVVFGIVLIILYPCISDWLNMSIPLVILMLIVFLFQPAYNLWFTRQRYEMKYKGVMIWSIIAAVISPLFGILAIILSKSENKVYPRLFGAELALVVIYIGFYIYHAKGAKLRINSKYWKYALAFNLPLIPHYLSSYLLNSSDKIMISKLISDSATAYYSVAYAVASIAFIVWTAVNGSLVPYTYEKCKERKFKDINRVVLPLLLLFATACIVVILLAPEVVAIMASKEYSEAIYVIPPIVGGVFFQVQYYIYANVVYYYKKPVYVMIGSVVTTAANIILNYIFINKYGYIAAGYTTLACYLLQAIIDYFAMKKVAGESVYNMKAISLLSVFIIVVSLGSNALYDYTWPRYVVLVLIVVAVVSLRKKIVRIISDMRG